MMHRLNFARLMVLPAIVLLAPFGSASAQTPRENLATGLQHFDAGRYTEALDAFKQAGEPADPLVLPELLHNRAAAHFKLGDYAAARDLWVRVAGMRDARWEAAARFNLGNCSYREALDKVARPAEPQPDAAAPPTDAAANAKSAIALLDRAIEQYRDAIRLDAQRGDARANIELAEQLKKKLEEKPPELQPQSQPSSQPQSQPSSQPQSQPSDSKGDQQQQDQSSSQPSSQPQDSQDQQSESQPSSQPQQDPNNPQPQEDQQESESQPSSQPQSQPQSRPRPQPAESQPAESQPAESQPAGEGEIDEALRREVERALQRVRDAERMRRMLLRQREMSKYKPAERDW